MGPSEESEQGKRRDEMTLSTRSSFKTAKGGGGVTSAVARYREFVAIARRCTTHPHRKSIFETGFNNRRRIQLVQLAHGTGNSGSEKKMKRTILRRLAAMVVCFAAGLLGSNKCESAPLSLRDSLKPLAQEIVAVVTKDQNQATITVGDFVGPADLDTNSGPGLTATLKSLLDEVQPGISQRRAPLALRGRFDKIPDPKDAQKILIKVTAEITDKNALVVDQKFIEIRDAQLLAGLMGLTVVLPPDNPDAANKDVQKALEHPSFAIEGTKIKAAEESRSGIEILVTSKENAPRDTREWARVPPRAPRNDKGEAFIDLDANEVYAIRIHNGFEERETRQKVGVFLTIDGLDVFTFSEMRDPSTGRPRYSTFIVNPGSSVIPGWHKTNSRVDSFLVTEYGKGAISSQPNISRGKVGVITVKFAPVPLPKPVELTDSGPSRGFRVGSAAPTAPAAPKRETGFGPSARTNMQESKSEIGEVREVISIRYSR
jgi:hypothetical protein